MSRLIKIISFLLTTVIVLSACQTVATETVPEYETDYRSKDLGGINIKWLKWADDYPLGYLEGTALSDVAMERKSNVEKDLNCKIELVSSNGADTGGLISGSVMSGVLFSDVFLGGTFGLVTHMRGGYFLGLSSYIDASDTEKWGTPNMLQSLLWNNDLYGVVPYAWPELLYTSFGYPIAVCEELIKQYGRTDPREYVENGTWTWDRFETALQEYTVQENGRTIYGFATHKPYYSMMMFLSNGVTLSDFEDGKVVCGAYTDRGFTALSRAREIYYETCADCIHPDDPWGGVGIDMIVNKDVFLVPLPTNEIFRGTDSVLYRASDVGILPFPLGPNATPNTYKSYHESLDFATVIPANEKEPEAVVAIISAMYEPFDEFKTKDDIINYMSNNVFFDERDANIIAMMLRNTEYGFFLEGARSVIESSLESGTPLSTHLESYKSRYDEIVEKYMVHHYSAKISVYGE